MCGIVGYIGNQKASLILIEGLKKLEYRGYDSAGISTIENGKLLVMKDKGRVKNLEEINGIDSLTGTIGIAHTRWATHGKPSKENSHPHLDNGDNFSVVHNGIIENYGELRKELEEKGIKFRSQTDTEVIPNLINICYEEDNSKDEQKMLKAVIKATKRLKGSFAIEVISKYDPDMMIVVRKDSPLVIGNGKNENYIASDIPAILSYTKDFYLLNDYEFAVIKRDLVNFYDENLNEIKKKTENIDWNSESCDKAGFDDYMLKEIFEQPTAIRETIGSRIPKNSLCDFTDLSFSKEYLEKINTIYIVACGTAMHAGLATKNIIEKFCKIKTQVDIASEFRYRDPLIDDKTLCIYISQSGETADTIAALKLAKEKEAKTLAISNVIGSSITREADYSIYTHAGPEISVASTKAYTSQVVLLSILAMYFAEMLGRVSKDEIKRLKEEIEELPKKVEEILKSRDKVQEFSKKIFNEKDVFFLGRGVDYYVAMEASLKLKEISYIHADAYASGELKHGPIALIDNGITVINILTDSKLVEKSISNIQEVITRGAKTLIITNQKLPVNNFENIINIPETSEYISPVLSIIPLQLMSYYITKEKGLDVDKPRNLAKSVTVE